MEIEKEYAKKGMAKYLFVASFLTSWRIRSRYLLMGEQRLNWKTFGIFFIFYRQYKKYIKKA